MSTQPVDLVPERRDRRAERGRRLAGGVRGIAVRCRSRGPQFDHRELAARGGRARHQARLPVADRLRPRLVILDSGKDQWESDTHGLELAARPRADDGDAARGSSGRSRCEVRRCRDSSRSSSTAPTSMQSVVLDRRARAYDRTVVGPGVTDIHDPRQLGPVTSSSRSSMQKRPSSAVRLAHRPRRGPVVAVQSGRRTRPLRCRPSTAGEPGSTRGATRTAGGPSHLRSRRRG